MRYLMMIPLYVTIGLWALVMIYNVFGLFDALARRAAAFTAADKQSKGFWIVILAVALLVNLLLANPLLFPHAGTALFLILTAVAALVYVVGVRPALKDIDPRGRGGRRTRSGGSGGAASGPYGPW